MDSDENRSRIRALIESGDEDKTIKDLNLNVDDYKALIEALKYIKDFKNIDTIQSEVNNASMKSDLSLAYISPFYALYDAIGCVLIKRGEIKYFDVLVRAGYFSVSQNMLHCVLDLNRNVASKVVDLANPETISYAVGEFIRNDTIETMVINRYFGTEKSKEAVAMGIKNSTNDE